MYAMYVNCIINVCMCVCGCLCMRMYISGYLIILLSEKLFVTAMITATKMLQTKNITEKYPQLNVYDSGRIYILMADTYAVTY